MATPFERLQHIGPDRAERLFRALKRLSNTDGYVFAIPTAIIKKAGMHAHDLPTDQALDRWHLLAFLSALIELKVVEEHKYHGRPGEHVYKLLTDKFDTTAYTAHVSSLR